MKNKKIYKLTLTAIFAALIFAATMLHINIGVNGGYVHLGDALIYLSAALLPTPYAICAAIIGGGLADLSSGAVLWILPTVIIKGFSAAFFTNKKPRLICLQNIIACIIGAVFCVGGYYIAEVLIYGCGFIIPIASIPANLIQTLASSIIFILISGVFDKLDLKKKLF